MTSFVILACAAASGTTALPAARRSHLQFALSLFFLKIKLLPFQGKQSGIARYTHAFDQCILRLWTSQSQLTPVHCIIKLFPSPLALLFLSIFTKDTGWDIGILPQHDGMWEEF